MVYSTFIIAAFWSSTSFGLHVIDKTMFQGYNVLLYVSLTQLEDRTGKSKSPTYQHCSNFQQCLYCLNWSPVDLTMSVYTQRRSTLRDVFSRRISRKLEFQPRGDRLKGRNLFRAAVRLVLLYFDWITEKLEIEEVSEDAALDAQLTEKKKAERKALSLEDRSILLIPPKERATKEKQHIFRLFLKYRAFKKYSENLRKRLAAASVYRYFPADRVIVRQGHGAENLYFIANGEVSLSKIVTDEITGEPKEVSIGTMSSGDTFGEIALLHMIPRTATAITKTPVDLFLIPCDAFNVILRDTLVKEWDILQDALVHFNYFKCWDEETIRECCILSKLKDFQPDEILLGDGKGMINYVHFQLNGECRLIEHMLVRKKRIGRKVRYELYEPEENPVKIGRKSLEKSQDSKTSVKTGNSTDADEHKEHVWMTDPTQKANKQSEEDRMSITTTTLLDVVNQWTEITEVTEMLMKQPSVTSQDCYPQDVRTVFMQICVFYRGACFGLGEQMQNRRIVAITPVRCFLIPRYWLLERNRANIWDRVKLFMDSKYLNKQQLFHEFVRNRKWKKYKENLVHDIVKKSGCVRTNVTIHDVPYSNRITNDTS